MGDFIKDATCALGVKNLLGPSIFVLAETLRIKKIESLPQVLSENSLWRGRLSKCERPAALIL